MDSADLIAMYDRCEEMRKLRDAALDDSDAAAHQLARYVSDVGHDELANLASNWPQLRRLVSLYEQSWLDYSSARDEWHQLVSIYQTAHAEYAGNIARRG